MYMDKDLRLFGLPDFYVNMFGYYLVFKEVFIG